MLTRPGEPARAASTAARHARPSRVRRDNRARTRATRPARHIRPSTIAAWGAGAAVLALGLILCAVALTALLGVASLFRAPWQPISDELGSAVGRAGQVAAASGQAVRDAFDSSHPPREALRQDAEFDALQVVGVGETLGGTSESRIDLARLAKRGDAASAATAQYAVVRRDLVTPQPRRVLGVPVGEDRGEREHVLYQGQSFRLGSHYYKVNWVSLDRQQVAIARYRSADGVIGGLVFEYD